ncbi:hypothetical protein [Blastopirellula marina]|uniref:Uncharacterized protein n=1 Tax=Blastopirellula marina TaxID=124 RepID=A0A2S8GF36_9BACT|nr:hypothetical protein [Blastopirellula marina]PQO43033.1 hypothetical protein C5Y93_25290 [Blastopirellula marina]
MGSDYFDESVPDGVANAVQELFPEIDCSGQDGYELLVMTFGDDVDGARFKAFDERHCREMAANLQSYLELSEPVSTEQGRFVIESALRQWGG